MLATSVSYLLSCEPPPRPLIGYVPNVPASVDQILENLGLGNIGFNTPKTLQLGEKARIQLLLSTRDPIEELQKKIVAAGEKEGAQKTTDRRCPFQSLTCGAPFLLMLLTFGR
jgi:hypothetical protein